MFFFRRKNQPEDPPDVRLMKSIKFIDKDLDANRSGVLTKAQRQRIRRGQMWGAVALWTVAIVFTSLVAFLGTRLEWQTEPGIWFLGVAALAFVAAAFRQQSKTKKILLNNQVNSVSGFVSRRIDMVYTGKVFIPIHKVTVGNKTFTVGNKAYDAFVEGEQYTIYYIPETDQVLSAELTYDAEKDKRLSDENPENETAYLHEAEEQQSLSH